VHIAHKAFVTHTVTYISCIEEQSVETTNNKWKSSLQRKTKGVWPGSASERICERKFIPKSRSHRTKRSVTNRTQLEYRVYEIKSVSSPTEVRWHFLYGCRSTNYFCCFVPIFFASRYSSLSRKKSKVSDGFHSRHFYSATTAATTFRVPGVGYAATREKSLRREPRISFATYFCLGKATRKHSDSPKCFVQCRLYIIQLTSG